MLTPNLKASYLQAVLVVLKYCGNISSTSSDRRQLTKTDRLMAQSTVQQ